MIYSGITGVAISLATAFGFKLDPAVTQQVVQQTPFQIVTVLMTSMPLIWATVARISRAWSDKKITQEEINEIVKGVFEGIDQSKTVKPTQMN